MFCRVVNFDIYDTLVSAFGCLEVVASQYNGR